jgi:mycoredoxin
MSRAAAGVAPTMTTSPPPVNPEATDAGAVDVYWRPGCGYCSRLLRHFDRAGVAVRLHNIWEDDSARRFVREHNGGDETVPTVAVGDVVVTNPSPRPFVEQLRAEHPHLVGESEPEGLFGRLLGRSGDA